MHPKAKLWIPTYSCSPTKPPSASLSPSPWMAASSRAGERWGWGEALGLSLTLFLTLASSPPARPRRPSHHLPRLFVLLCPVTSIHGHGHAFHNTSFGVTLLLLTFEWLSVSLRLKVRKLAVPSVLWPISSRSVFIVLQLHGPPCCSWTKHPCTSGPWHRLFPLLRELCPWIFPWLTS